MRTTTLQTLFSQLPPDLRLVIKEVNKKSTAGGQSTAIQTTSDNLWLFSEVEIDGTTVAGYAGEGEQYQYWKTVKNGTVAADRIKYLSNGSDPTYIWWLRSPYIENNLNFMSITTLGVVANSAASLPEGVCFGFCV